MQFVLCCSCFLLIIIKSTSGQVTPAPNLLEAYIKGEVKRQMGEMFDIQMIKEEIMRKLEKDLKKDVKGAVAEENQATKQVQDVLKGEIDQLKLTVSSLEQKYMKHLYKKLKQLETTCSRCHQGTTTAPAGWDLWGSWTPCSSSCGSGIRARNRTCNSPTEQGACQGETAEIQSCQGHDCAVWTSWQIWSQCNVECGEGIISRSRKCQGGTTCQGSSTENKPCKQKKCAGKCEEPGKPDNGIMIGRNYSHGAEVHYVCDSSFMLVGSSRRRCLQSGLWSGDEPRCTALHRLSKPVLELNLTRTSPQLTKIWRVAALPGGEAVIYNPVSIDKTRQVIKINERGLPVQHLYSCVICNGIGGLLVLGDDIFIVHGDGTVVRVNHQDGRVVRVYHIQNVSNVNHQGSLSSNPALIVDKDLLLLADGSKGEVFTYRLSTEQKVVRLTGLSTPNSISYLYTQQAVYYVVCEYWSSTVSVYNSSWSRVSTMGRSSQITLSNPTAAITSLEQTILVADYNNNRIVELSKEGEFIRHLISVRRPHALSISFPHLWVTGNSKLYRYRIYKT